MNKPRLNQHKHKESNCQVCIGYIKRLDEYRKNQSHGGDVKSKKILRLSVTSHSNNTRQGERKFDLPKPRLVRPFLVIKHKQQSRH